ncbi:hypothetical protein GQ44DRAFT_733176 [Phaeosphaeriaceae sp. PMI808]|nr:hypothetical protein GQ44DRAFT_733176 [Phaeosphaeriaceae sp. PMI808]
MQSCALTRPNHLDVNLFSLPIGEYNRVALNEVRNSSSAFETCCGNPGAEFNPLPSKPGCFRYCNVTAPGLTVERVNTCLTELMFRAGLEGWGVSMDEPVKPGSNSSSSSPTSQPTSTRSPTSSPIPNGAMGRGGLVGWAIMGLVTTSLLV